MPRSALQPAQLGIALRASEHHESTVLAGLERRIDRDTEELETRSWSGFPCHRPKRAMRLELTTLSLGS